MAKREITIDGEKLWFCGLTGQVAGEKKWSETHIAGGGGGGHVSGGYGFSAPVSVSSSVVTRHEFWLVSPDGGEACITNNTNSLNVREGQWMTVIWGAEKKQGNGPYVMIRNHNTHPPLNVNMNTNCADTLKRMGVRDPGKAVWFALIPVLFLLWLSHSLIVAMIAVIPLLLVLAAVAGKLRLQKWQRVMQAAGEVMELEIKDAQGRAAMKAGQYQGRIAR